MRKKLCLLIFILLLGFVLVNNVSAKTYQFSCGFSTREVYNTYAPLGFPGVTEKEAYVSETDYGYRSQIEFTFQRTGAYGVKIVDCHQADYYYLDDSGDAKTKWKECDYDSYVFDWNGRKGVDMTQPTYCPDGINIEGNVVKSVDEAISDYVYVSGENYKTPPEKIKETINICPDYNNSVDCKNSPDYGCVWVDKEKYDFLEESYCNVDNLLYVGCGGASDIPMQVPKIISMAVNLLKIATPIILIFISIITLVKALAAGKEDEIKKATSSLTKKMIAAALVFFVVAIVQFVISKVADDEDDYKNFTNCLNCFLNNDCDAAMYYKTVVAGEDMCTPISTGKIVSCDNMPIKGVVNLTNSVLTEENGLLVWNFTFDSIVDVKEIMIVYTNNSSMLTSEDLILDKSNQTASVRIGGVLETSNPYLIVIFNNDKEQTIDLNYTRG